MNIDLSQFTGVFFEETAEHLAEMEHLLLGLDSHTPDADQLNSIFRAAHSIKGSAGVFGFQALSSVTHVLENLLDKLRTGVMSLQPGMVDTFLAATDCLKDIAQTYKAGGQPDMAAANVMCERLERFINAPSATAVEETAYGLFAEPDRRSVETYGFFTEPSATAGEGLFQASATSTRPENDDGYGFFTEPLTEPHARPEHSASTAEHSNAVAATSKPATSKPASKRSGKPNQQAERVENASHRAGEALIEDYVNGVFGGSTANATEPVTAPAPVSLTPPPAMAAPTLEAPSVRQQSTPSATTTPPRKAEPVVAESTTIRVSTEKIDQIINLVGELVITQSMLAQTASELTQGSHERLNDRMKTLERNTRDLQEAVMSIRMMPVSFIFNRFPRVVRDLAQKLNKQVELVIEGEHTELDKGLIEKLADPLTHLVRNSIDHGIESPAQRAAAGKPEKGTIRLSAFQRSGNIIIEVSDDGGGLRRDKILAKAEERGLPVSADMTDADVWQLIFAPGFSTAEQVTDVSGRGVGMDVVKRNIQEIGGRIEIASEAGQGSTMTIRLPLTLAILDGMVVAVGTERYIIPLVFISESLQPAPEDIRTVTGTEKVVKVRDDYIPLCALHEHMGVKPRIVDATEGLLVVLENEEKKMALLVDELLGQQQVVIKSLEGNYRRVEGVSGATIMGDGRVALILNIEQLMARQSDNLVSTNQHQAKRGAA
ncbi:MAG TPA: chemotaxis protein CheA [Permianibacter sp.]|nr:chemotaxis protein CheA [Permianibacter sp.]